MTLVIKIHDIRHGFLVVSGVHDILCYPTICHDMACHDMSCHDVTGYALLWHVSHDMSRHDEILFQNISQWWGHGDGSVNLAMGWSLGARPEGGARGPRCMECRVGGNKEIKMFRHQVQRPADRHWSLRNVTHKNSRRNVHYMSGVSEAACVTKVSGIYQKFIFKKFGTG